MNEAIAIAIAVNKATATNEATAIAVNEATATNETTAIAVNEATAMNEAIAVKRSGSKAMGTTWEAKEGKAAETRIGHRGYTTEEIGGHTRGGPPARRPLQQALVCFLSSSRSARVPPFCRQLIL